MLDPVLYEALHGIKPASKPTTSTSTSKKVESDSKNRFELALDETIKKYVDTLMMEEDPSKLQLTPPEIRHKALEKQIKDSLDSSELGQHIEMAVNIFQEQGKNYLSEDEHEDLLRELDKVENQLENVDLSLLNDENFKKALVVSSQGKASILKIGSAKFSEGMFKESLSIFAFLSAIDPDDPDYWYRLGLAAQECESYELAVRAYEQASNLAKDFIGTHIFTAQCYLDLGNLTKASLELSEVKNRLKEASDQEKWGQYVIDIETLITHANSFKPEV